MPVASPNFSEVLRSIGDDVLDILRKSIITGRRPGVAKKRAGESFIPGMRGAEFSNQRRRRAGMGGDTARVQRSCRVALFRA
jgi:hypothetical protein